MFIDLTVGDKFHLDSVSGKFVGSDKYIKNLVSHLSHEEKEIIKNRVYEVFEYVEYSGLMTILTLADLIKKKDAPFALMPMILNYGKDLRLSHQTAFLYDQSRDVLIFYEPYGTYKKYGIDYKNLFDPLRYILFGRHGKVVTFHKMYGFDIGLQMMIINNNKATTDAYTRELEHIKARYDKLSNSQWRSPTDDNKKFDNTIESIRILGDVEKVALKNGDKKLLLDAYVLFYKYSAKTCVTLTFIDMFFFSRYGVEMIRRFYKDVSMKKYPSVFLIDTFVSILRKTHPKNINYILRILGDINMSNKKIKKILLP